MGIFFVKEFHLSCSIILVLLLCGIFLLCELCFYLIFPQKLVNIVSSEDVIGKIVEVRIDEAKSFSLNGTRVEEC